jgi:hypothetical protein
MAVCNAGIGDRDDDLFASRGDFPGIWCVDIGPRKPRPSRYVLSEIIQSPEDAVTGTFWIEGGIIGEDLTGMDNGVGLRVLDVGILPIEPECFLYREGRREPQVVNSQGREGPNEG